MPTADERPLLTRDAIVAAARDLVIASGLEALSLRRLATALGVTAPALYAHVDGKGDLLRALAEQQFATLEARFGEVDEADPVERIRAHGRAYVDLAREQPELFRLLFLFPPELAAAGELPDAIELPAATRAFGHAVGAVEEAAASGALVTDDPLLAALTLWSAAHGVAQVLQLGFGLPRELEDALVAEATDRLLRGYAPAP